MSRCFFIFLFVFAFINSKSQILNPGFESGLTGWLSFTPLPASTQFVPDNTTFHSGAASGKIISTLTSTNAAAYYQVPTVTAGKNYEFSYWVKTDTIEKYLFSYVIFKDAVNNDITKITNATCSQQANWYRIKFRFKAPPNAAKALLAIFIMNKGTLWLDDVSLTQLTDTTYHALAVDLQTNKGSFKKLLGTNMGPVNPYSLQDYTAKFQEIGIDYVRTHDYHIAFDFHVIFPDSTRDPQDPTAFNFTKTDSCIADISKANAKILFRLGESASADVAYRTPPANIDKWAAVAVQIIKHYNNGWNNGFNYGIKYWEIWNEPDLDQFWNGTIQQYIRLYHVASTAIKNFDSTLKVGGPAFSVAYDARWMNDFLDSVKQNNIPLDFLSYHLYDLFNPYNLYTLTNFVKQNLLIHGLVNTELILDEWNPYAYNDLPSNYGKDDALNAASTISGINYLQAAPVDKLFRYATDILDFPLFNWNNTYTYQGYAYKASGKLIRMDTKLATTGGDTLGTTISAGKTATNNLATVLIADNSSAANGYTLAVNGILPGETWHYQTTRIDSTNKYIVIDSGYVTKALPVITQKVQAPFADQIQLSRVATFPDPNVNGGYVVYPNPFSKKITLLNVSTENIECKLLNLFGQTVWRGRSIETHDFSALPSGLYFLKLNTQAVLKLIKLN